MSLMFLVSLQGQSIDQYLGQQRMDAALSNLQLNDALNRMNFHANQAYMSTLYPNGAQSVGNFIGCGPPRYAPLITESPLFDLLERGKTNPVARAKALKMMQAAKPRVYVHVLTPNQKWQNYVSASPTLQSHINRVNLIDSSLSKIKDPKQRANCLSQRAQSKTYIQQTQDNFYKAISHNKAN